MKIFSKQQISLFTNNIISVLASLWTYQQILRANLSLGRLCRNYKGPVKLIKGVKIAHSFFIVCVKSVPRNHFKLAYVILQMTVNVPLNSCPPL